MFPLEIVFLAPGVSVPSKGNYYLITANGIFLHKETGIINATVPVDGIGFLESHAPKVNMDMPEIPAQDMATVLAFFALQWKRNQAEAVVLLHYCPETRSFLFHCPPQRVTIASVDYDMSRRYPGYLLVGSIHSHGILSAWHSCEDERNERHFDGLHITVGNVNTPSFSVVSSMVVNNYRVPVDPRSVIGGIHEDSLILGSLSTGGTDGSLGRKRYVLCPRVAGRACDPPEQWWQSVQIGAETEESS